MAGETQTDWLWHLRASPEALWPHVCNTERFNKAIGMPEPTFTDTARDEGGSARTGEARQVGMTMRWVERPYEWLAPSWMSVLREYQGGPLASLRTDVRLEPTPAGGTTLHYSLIVRTNGLVGRVAQIVEFSRLRAQMERVFHRIDDKVSEASGVAQWHLDLDPFETPRDHLNQRGLARLTACTTELQSWRLPDPALVEQLPRWVRYGADHLVERMRPIALARRWGVSADAALDVCLVAAHVGMLDVIWSVLCPSCRSTSAEATQLARLAPTTHCDACNIDFETEFVESVELSFRPAPAIREVTPGTYCLGGPGHKPSAIAQVWLQPGEVRDVSLALAVGSWRVAGPRADGQVYIDVRAAGPSADTTPLLITVGPTLELSGAASAGSNEVRLHNTSPHDQVLRIERAAWRDDAITAAQAMTRATFRQLFSADVLSPGSHVDVGRVAILFTDLEGSTALYEAAGDAGAYAMVRQHFEVIEAIVARHRGAVVKTIGDAVMAAWHDPLDAVIAALSLQSALAARDETASLRLTVGVHWGRCIGVTVNGIFDYFGTTVNTAARLERVAQAGEVAISTDLAEEPTVAAWLTERPACWVRTVEQSLKGLRGTHRCVILSDAGAEAAATDGPKDAAAAEDAAQ